MIGKIDKKGMLHIDRAGIMIVMNCALNDDIYCSHQCPLFGEPEPEESFDEQENEYQPTGGTSLSLCKKTLVFDSFVDERIGEVSK